MQVIGYCISRSRRRVDDSVRGPLFSMSVLAMFWRHGQCGAFVESAPTWQHVAWGKQSRHQIATKTPLHWYCSTPSLLSIPSFHPYRDNSSCPETAQNLRTIWFHVSLTAGIKRIANNLTHPQIPSPFPGTPCDPIPVTQLILTSHPGVGITYVYL